VTVCRYSLVTVWNTKYKTVQYQTKFKTDKKVLETKLTILLVCEEGRFKLIVRITTYLTISSSEF